VQVQFKQVNLRREKLELSPVFATTVLHDGHRLGYIRLASFSQKAAQDTRKAILRLEVRRARLQRGCGFGMQSRVAVASRKSELDLSTQTPACRPARGAGVGCAAGGPAVPCCWPPAPVVPRPDFAKAAAVPV
jgi:hypothetical protein